MVFLFVHFGGGGARGGGNHPFAQRNLDALFPFILFFATFMIDIPMLVLPLGLLVLFAGSGGGGEGGFGSIDWNSPALKLFLAVLALFWFLASMHSTEHHPGYDDSYADSAAAAVDADDDDGEDHVGGNGDLTLFLSVVVAAFTIAHFRRDIHARLPRSLQGPFSVLVQLLFGMEDLRNGPTSQEAIDALETVTFPLPADDEHHQHDQDCAVCLDAFAAGDEAKRLPCKHVFHGDCLLPWLRQRNTCPVCRQVVDGGGGGGAGAGGVAGVWAVLAAWAHSLKQAALVGFAVGTRWAGEAWRLLWSVVDSAVLQKLRPVEAVRVPETRESLMQLPLKELRQRARLRNVQLPGGGLVDKREVVELLLAAAGGGG